MTNSKAAEMLNKRVSSEFAIEILTCVDSGETEIYGVEGFVLKSNGEYESRLDLMFDVSSIQNLTHEEKRLFVREFVERRAGNHVFSEVYGE